MQGKSYIAKKSTKMRRISAVSANLPEIPIICQVLRKNLRMTKSTNSELQISGGLLYSINNSSGIWNISKIPKLKLYLVSAPFASLSVSLCGLTHFFLGLHKCEDCCSGARMESTPYLVQTQKWTQQTRGHYISPGLELEDIKYTAVQSGVEYGQISISKD